MKKKILYLPLILLIALCTDSCKKTEPQPVVTHKGVVLYNVCGNVVIQTTGPNYLGEDNWMDTNNPSNPTYNHVFSVANSCNFGMYNYGDSIEFSVIAPQPQTCAVCLIYVAKPATSYNIRVIK